jgi:hypothetical protein
MNGSLDFLNMIRNQEAGCNTERSSKETPRPQRKASAESKRETIEIDSTKANIEEMGSRKNGNVVSRNNMSSCGTMIAVIDTETNWHDEVMSVGIALADASDYRCVDKRYYIFDQEARVGGIYSYVVHMRNLPEVVCTRKNAVDEIRKYLDENGVTKILAYNAKFDYNHLPELGDYDWYDIMRLAAYKQYNKAIPESLPCCKTGRLKTNYGVEPIMQMLTGNMRYSEVHNAVMDAVDELKIVELLGHGMEVYECAKL